MSQEDCQTELRKRSQQLLEGPLKHIRAAALAAALLPLASVAAAPAAAQDCPPSQSGGSVCGFVWSDTNGDGDQDSGEPGIPGVTVTLGANTYVTGGDGFYYFFEVGQVTQVIIEIPQGFEASPPNATADDTRDSDGMSNGTNSVATVPVGEISDADFGFAPPDDEGGLVPTPCDFLTSGGFVINNAGKKVTFGIHGGCKHGEFWGHLNVVDHATGYHINSTDITGYLVPNSATPNTREICGLASTNGSSDPPSIAFRVRLTDNGEPGSLDLFGIRLSSGYHVSPRLLSALKPGGGNIQLHDPNPSTTAPEAPPQCWGLDSP